mmetsp:Transcript_14519/g.35158  ORF Transcript_14519/g.35158 Transcript_14519/m.35158 type:complete len:324 (-) Transcript_14519:1780-2751(-)
MRTNRTKKRANRRHTSFVRAALPPRSGKKRQVPIFGSGFRGSMPSELNLIRTPMTKYSRGCNSGHTGQVVADPLASSRGRTGQQRSDQDSLPARQPPPVLAHQSPHRQRPHHPTPPGLGLPMRPDRRLDGARSARAAHTPRGAAVHRSAGVGSGRPRLSAPLCTLILPLFFASPGSGPHPAFFAGAPDVRRPVLWGCGPARGHPGPRDSPGRRLGRDNLARKFCTRATKKILIMFSRPAPPNKSHSRHSSHLPRVPARTTRLHPSPLRPDGLSTAGPSGTWSGIRTPARRSGRAGPRPPWPSVAPRSPQAAATRSCPFPTSSL